MKRDVAARTWFGVTALAAIAGLAIQLGVTASNEEGHFQTVAGRIFNMFCFFTVQSNVIVAVTFLLLALRLQRTSTWFRVFWLIGVIDISITGVVYHVALRELQELHGDAAVADALLHTVAPIMAPLGWLLFGPRGLPSRRVAALAVLFPLGWGAFTLIRGPIVDWYPYPFIDVNDLGYARVLANCAVIAVLFGVIAVAITWLDGWLTRRFGRQPVAATP